MADLHRTQWLNLAHRRWARVAESPTSDEGWNIGRRCLVPSDETPTAAAERAVGVRAIVVYKTAKAGVELGLFLILAALWPLGLVEHLADFARALTDHGNHGWSLALARWLQSAVSAHGIALAMGALMLDGLLTAVEAWALASRRWWGPWLVVVSTASLLPFEVFEFMRQPRASRVVLFVVNLAIAIYLAGHAWRAPRSDPRG